MDLLRRSAILACLLTYAHSQTWTVQSGDCTTTGVCVRSPNFGSANYPNSVDCSIKLNNGGYLTDTHFTTESGMDRLNLRRRGASSYHGRRRSAQINDIYLAQDELISWDADWALTYTGWEICWSPTAQGIGSRRRYSGIGFPTIHTTVPAVDSSEGTGCCVWTTTNNCYYLQRSCGGLEGKTNCWVHAEHPSYGGDPQNYCVAESASECCESNSGALAGIIIGCFVFCACLAVGSCFFCSSCPVAKSRRPPQLVTVIQPIQQPMAIIQPIQQPMAIIQPVQQPMQFDSNGQPITLYPVQQQQAMQIQQPIGKTVDANGQPITMYPGQMQQPMQMQQQQAMQMQQPMQMQQQGMQMQQPMQAVPIQPQHQGPPPPFTN